MSQSKYQVNENGYYGEFGGAYIPDTLISNIEELKKCYLEIMNTPSFREEFDQLLHDYVGRPSPLYFAERLSEKYNTRIYLKREDLNHTGAHKINNTIGQILLAKRMGKKRIIAETGAGSHGVAAATVAALMNMPCTVFMGEVDIQRQAFNVLKMKMLGTEVRSVHAGTATLNNAVDAALTEWSKNPDETHYLIGSAVGPHPFPDIVARFQSVISEEIKKQLLEKENRDYPDYLMACLGGGSNAAGTFYHYLDDERVHLLAAEAGGLGVESGKTAATIQVGKPRVLHGSRTLVMEDAEGNVQDAYTISAGLDYPGIGPMHANLARTGRMEVLAINDDEAVRAAFELTKLEGIIPAIESAHALAMLERKKFRPDDVVVITISGRGDKDMDTYIQLMENK